MGWNPTLVLVKDRNTDRRTTPGGLAGEIPKELRFKTRMEKKTMLVILVVAAAIIIFFFFFFFV